MYRKRAGSGVQETDVAAFSTFEPGQDAHTGDCFWPSDAEAEVAFRKLRWASTAGKLISPTCDSPDAYDCRRPNGATRFRGRGCQKDFSITSGTIFASLKRPLRLYLAAIVIFCKEHKGNPP
ncbi:hypothetical protein EKN06_14605 [Croceicoccus ponticola]|uniref:Uncharacterized protein n=1 Tax=Croceicoccus ponticola TaxID=2217664 RepID=A0A437GUG8_9SPHN|nr:hypothetical protein EKN06_14605 [Croceicoccus ponticola]